MSVTASPSLTAETVDDPDWVLMQRVVGDAMAHDGPQAALEVIEAAIAAGPRDGNLRMIHGQVLLALRHHGEASAALRHAMALGTDIEILDLLAEAMFPGPRYRDHLAALHEWLRPERYLEIGVFKGETLALARPGTQAIGVDPAPRPEAARAYAAATTILRMTSDACFANDAPQIAGKIDLAFIDGLHLFEQVLRDVINVERCCQPGSVIVLHDTLPVAQAATARLRRTSHWCGDVWKIVPCLRRHRPDLAMLTIPTHPSGLTLITRLDPSCGTPFARTLADRFDEVVAEWVGQSLPPVPAGGDVANDVAAVRAALDAVITAQCRHGRA